MGMRPDQRRLYEKIIDGFETNFQLVLVEDRKEETPLLRVAFYKACLELVRDGPRLNSHIVQFNLIRFYERKLTQSLKKVVDTER